tara:strand:+ start:842 stop:955 length:114 start_codon:yes stop_codon:yes gene_type:complete
MDKKMNKERNELWKKFEKILEKERKKRKRKIIKNIKK